MCSADVWEGDVPGISEKFCLVGGEGVAEVGRDLSFGGCEWGEDDDLEGGEEGCSVSGLLNSHQVVADVIQPDRLHPHIPLPHNTDKPRLIKKLRLRLFPTHLIPLHPILIPPQLRRQLHPLTHIYHQLPLLIQSIEI